MKIHSLLALFFATTLHAGPPPPAGRTVPLFDGETLRGWEGDPKLWRVEDGCLTGGSLTEKVAHNDFLASTADFGNFIVRFKIKLTGTEGFINSGFQIRSQRVPKNSEMSGYQCDFGDPNWWGAIYDESRRNKVLAPADMAALGPVIKRQDWNEYVIRAEGPRITTWLNGVQATDYTEADPAIPQSGKFGIQVHGGGKALVQMKDLTIEELPPTPGKSGADLKSARSGDRGLQVHVTSSGRDVSYNAVSAGAKSPEEERASFQLLDGFEAQLVAAESEGIGKFVPIAFDQRGALWTTTAFEYPVDGNENAAAADALYASKAKDKVLVFDRDPSQPTGYSPKPRVFADGLAIPLGVLPYKDGCYVQHGHDIAFLRDTDGDGKADQRTVILTGFGVQDSHLFPHQFMRAPGGWIWMAQGAFNYSKVRRPDDPPEKAVQFDQTRMAKFRPDGTGFEITSNGPCNIWGLVLNGEGEAFIQEANDFGYPVMPFHEYANYPGCSDRQWKSYAPEFPGTATFKVGGTGLSGLALLDAGWVKLLDAGKSDQSSVGRNQSGDARSGTLITDHRSLITSSQTMLVANPITNRINAIKMHRDGPRWRLEQLPDFVVSSDPWFRPVAIAVGPDGCLYIVDWYNKIISHNEVPRNHPDRDKTRGRIWRVKATAQKPFDVPNFTKLSGDELIAKLGGDSLAQSHLAWQAIVDRREALFAAGGEEKLIAIVCDKAQSPARRIQALWAVDGMRRGDDEYGRILAAVDFPGLLKDPNRNLRRELLKVDQYNGYTAQEEVDTLSPLLSDSDPEVRGQAFHSIAAHAGFHMTLESREEATFKVFTAVLPLAREPLAEPVAPSTHKPQRQIKVREAYDREFERYLVRMFLERHPEAVAKFLDSDAAREQPVEARLLATLALEQKTSAERVAKLLPQLQRAPGQEEVLRLAQFPDEPGVGEALKAILANPATRASTLEALLAVRTRLDAGKITPLLAEAASALLSGQDTTGVELGVKLASAFKLAQIEPALVALMRSADFESARPAAIHAAEPPAAQNAASRADSKSALRLAALRALGELGSSQTVLFAELVANSADAQIRDEALTALAASKGSDAPQRLLDLWPKLASGQQRTALGRLSMTKPGAKAIVAALKQGTLAKNALDAAALDRLQAVLGEKDPDFAALAQELGTLFRPVLALDGSDAAWTETGLTLEGPFTVETWVRLDPDIDNNDGLLGVPGQLDINFFGAKLRVWIGGRLNDAVVSKKPMTPDLWTHVAVTRDGAGLFKLYQDGELVSDQSKPAPGKFENVRIAWTGPKGGTAGALSEFRIWNIDRAPEAIRRDFDRSYLRPATGDGKRSVTPAEIDPLLLTQGLVFASASDGWGKLSAGARIVKTSDFPPLLTADEAAALDAKYAKFRALAAQPGDPASGKLAAALCQACHLMGPTGGNIGPNLSGVGSMGTEAILRNVLQPNAAMENGYRIYRVELKNGDLLDALFVSEDKDAVVVRLPGSDDRRIAKADIRKTQYLRRSLMPEGLLDAFTPQQVSDLFSYLLSLK